MTTKNIEFKVSINQQEANKQIADLQQRLQSVQKTQQYGERAKNLFGDGTTMSKEAQRIFSNQQSEEMKFMREKFNTLQRYKQNQDKMYADNNKALSSENMMEKEKIRILQQQSEIKTRMTNIQKQQIEIAERAKTIDPDLKGFKGAGARPAGFQMEPDYQRPQGQLDWSKVMPDKSRDDITSQIVKSIGVQKIAGLIAAGIQGSANFAASTFFEYGSNISRQQAGTIGSMGRASGMDALLSGRGIELPYYARERQAALSNAQSSLSGLSTRGIGGMVAQTVAGAGTGAMLAGAAGLAGGPLAALTATGGAVVGGGLALGKSLFSGQTGAGISSFMRGEGYGAGVDQYRTSYLADNFESNMKAEQEKSYFKTKSLGYLEGNRPGFVQAQQMSGMGDSSLFNYLGEAGGLYTTADKMGAMSGIASAGGSSAQMRNGRQALDLKRDYGIQNAAGIIGGLSGNIGGGKVGSDEAVKKILSDAFSIGLDSSNFSRETEKFVSISAKFVEDSGARTPEAMKAIAADMSSFVASNSMKGLDAASGAREQLEGELGAGGSEYQKSLQMSSLRRNKAMKELSSAQMISLTNMSPDQIKAGGLELEAMAQATGQSPEEFQKQAMQSKEFAMTPFASTDRKMNKIKEMSASLGVKPTLDELNKAIANETDPDRKKQLEELKSEAGGAISDMTTYNSGFAGKNAIDKESSLMGRVGFNDTRAPGVMAPMRGETGMEQGEKAQARSEQIMLQKAQESFGEYVTAANSASKATMAATEAFENFINAVTSKSKDLEGYAQKMIDAQSTPGGTYRAPRAPAR